MGKQEHGLTVVGLHCVSCN